MPDVTNDRLENEPAEADDNDLRLTLDEDPPSRGGDSATPRRDLAEARPDNERAEAETSRRETDHPTEIGRTSGGGSLGHTQPDDVERDTQNRNATGSDDDPVMPRDDATLKTKI